MFYSLALRLFAGEGLRFRLRSWQVNTGGRAPWTTILFIPFSVLLHKLKSDWDKDCKILRGCPICERDTIIGHGRRTKQAHDEYHDWIGIRRGRCLVCRTTFTLLPLFSLPYTHYSLLARCQALRRRFVEHCSWEEATPTCKDPDRVADASTLRRWSSHLDRTQLALSFLRQTIAHVAHWLARARQSDHETWLLPCLIPILQILRPLRL